MNASDKLTKLSGYHWAILLAAKDVPLSTSEDKDSIRWDVTNEDNPANNWRFRRAPVNQYLNVSLCAWILLAKFDANDRESTLVSVGDVLESVIMSLGILPIVGTPPRTFPIDNGSNFSFAHHDIPERKVTMSEH